MARRGRRGAGPVGLGGSSEKQAPVGCRARGQPAGRPSMRQLSIVWLIQSGKAGGAGQRRRLRRRSWGVWRRASESADPQPRREKAGRNCDGHRTPARPPLAHLMPDVTGEATSRPAPTINCIASQACSGGSGRRKWKGRRLLCYVLSPPHCSYPPPLPGQEGIHESAVE